MDTLRTNDIGAAATATAAELDAMDDKLRRLGLDAGRSAAATLPAGGPQRNEDYIRRIRATKMAKRQDQLERAARQAVIAEKHHIDNTAVQDTGAPDKAQLADAVAVAAEEAHQGRHAATTTRLLAGWAASVAPAEPSMAPTPHPPHPPATPASSAAKTAPLRLLADPMSSPAQPWCRGVASGLVELAVSVSDNRHLPPPALGDRPVYRTRQDLGVTQWRTWVAELVFARAESEAAAARHVESLALAGEAGEKRDGTTSFHTADGSASGVPAEVLVQNAAAQCMESAQKIGSEEAVAAQRVVVAEILKGLQSELVRQRRAAEDSVRRAADVEPKPAPQALPGAVEMGEATVASGLDATMSSATGDQHPHNASDNNLTTITITGPEMREEVLPGWVQRMPPAGCFVFGDDLSGARLLADSVDLCVQKCQRGVPSTTAAPTTPAPLATPVPAGGHGGGNASLQASTTFHSTTSHSTPLTDEQRPQQPPTVANPEQVEATEGEASVVDSIGPLLSLPADPLATFRVTDTGLDGGITAGLRVLYATPCTLLGPGVASAVAPSWEGNRPNQGQRSVKAPAHGATTANTAAGAGGAPSFSPSSGGAVSGGGAGTRGARLNGSVIMETGRCGSEMPLAEAAVAEVVRVHRHNLGVLAGDRVPAWAIASTEDGSPACLQTLLLLGFPDTSTFAETFATRLQAATAALEAELITAEAERRVGERLRLDEEAAAAAVAEQGRQRSGSTRGPRGGPSPGRSKANRQAKVTPVVEDSAVPAMIAELRRTLALPPLSTLAVFFVYNAATRQRRVEAAAVSASPSSGDGAMSEDDMGGSISGVNGGEGDGSGTSSTAASLLHPIYHPWRTEVKETVPSRNSSFRRVPGANNATLINTTTVTSIAFASADTLPSGYTLCRDAWDIVALRAELDQQHRRQRWHQQQWAAAVTGSGPSSKPTVESVVDSLMPSTPSAGAARKKERAALGGGTGGMGSPAQEGERLLTSSLRGSNLVRSLSKAGGSFRKAVSAARLASAAEEKESAVPRLPRVLFFTRVQDVSDASDKADAAAVGAETTLDGVAALGSAAWGSSNVDRLDRLHTSQPPTAPTRATVTDDMIAQLHRLCWPAGGRALAAEALLPHQLRGPFRLSDYRLPESVCTELWEVHASFASRLPDSSAFLNKVSEQSRSTEGEAALAAEAAAWGSVMSYAEALHSLVAHDVFASAAPTDTGAADLHAASSAPVGAGKKSAAAATTMNSTAHFVSIDRSYARAKDAAAGHTVTAAAHLHDRLSLLLRTAMDACAGQLAGTVSLLCQSLYPSSATRKSLPLLAATVDPPGIPPEGEEKEEEEEGEKAPEGGSDGSKAVPVAAAPYSELEKQLLSRLQRLPEELARELVGQVLTNAADGTSLLGPVALRDRLVQWYSTNAHTAVLEVLTSHLETHHANAFLGPLNLLTDTPSPITVKAGGRGSLASQLPGIAITLVAQSMMQPCSLYRVCLLLCELRSKATALRNGTDAWVEVLYRDMLSMPPGSTGRRERRPLNIDQLADGPAAMLADGILPQQSSSPHDLARFSLDSPPQQPSRWGCGDVRLYLSAMESDLNSGAVSCAHFQRGLLLNQLPRLWRHVQDRSAALAMAADYTLTSSSSAYPAAREAWAHCHSGGTTATAPSGGAEGLPDTWPDAYLLSDCPSRPSNISRIPNTGAPFLTTADVRKLAALASGLSEEEAERAAAVDVTAWMADLVLGRCCYCDDADRATESTTAVDSTNGAVRHSRCRFVSLPSTHSARTFIYSLPESLLMQAASLDDAEAAHVSTVGGVSVMGAAAPAAPSPPPQPGQEPEDWKGTRWWWQGVGLPLSRCISSVEAGRIEATLCWALWCILAPSCTEQETKLTEVFATMPHRNAPTLLQILRVLLIGAARPSHGIEERVRRAFHCLAALRTVVAAQQAGCPVAEEAETAAMVEDRMALTLKEIRLLQSLLAPPGLPAVPSGGATGVHHPLDDSSTRPLPCGVEDLAIDVQLLLQVDASVEVTLPLLLTSRWGQLLLAAHF